MADEVREQKPATQEKPADKPRREAKEPSGLLFDFLILIGEVGQLAWQAFRTILRRGVDVGDLLAQMAAVGADSIWIVMANTLATGGVFTIYTANLSLQFGVPNFVGGTLAYAFFNELGPMLAGVALASRSGAAIAAEIGSMVVTEQVDALRAMAVSPVRYLVIPRVLAAMIMLPVLTIIADMSGLIGGAVSSTAYGIAPTLFWTSVRQFTEPLDMIHGLVKAVVFGFLIGIVACQQGLRTKGGATGVGRATTSSVVLCVVLIFLSDVFLAQMLTKHVVRR